MWFPGMWTSSFCWLCRICNSPVRAVLHFTLWPLSLACALALGAAEPQTRPLPELPPHPADAATHSPVDYFRHLLSLPNEEREVLLSERPIRQRQLLSAKIEEYAALPQDEREARLHLVQLRSYLLPLMKLPPSHRADQLLSIPESHRQTVVERLKQWDHLSPRLQQDVLNYELTLNYFIRMEAGTGGQREVIWDNFPESYRQMLEQRFQQWKTLPPQRRQRIYRDVQQFFELPPQQKEKTLETLSESDRHDMQRALRPFQQLPPKERLHTIESLRKFTNLTQEQRDQFLRNAERWKSLTPEERETWRNLVTELPPTPPGVGFPPLPPGAYQTAPPMGATSQEPPPSGANDPGFPPP
jgi:hypothetical protein